MATVRNLNGAAPAAPFGNAPTITDRQTITAKDVGAMPSDLIPASAGQVVENIAPGESSNLPAVNPPGDGALALAGMFGGLPALPSNSGAAVADELGGSATFVGRASDRAKNWGSLQALGIKNGDLYVGFEGQFARTMPMTYWLVESVVFKTLMNDLGGFDYATMDLNAETSPSGLKLDEHILALVVVDLGHRLVPAKADFRGTMSGAVSPVIRTVNQASDPKWASISDAHKVSAAFPVPWGRVVGTAQTQQRTSRTKGRVYYAGVAGARPAKIDEMQRLAAAMSDPQFGALVEQAKEGYRERFETIHALCDRK